MIRGLALLLAVSALAGCSLFRRPHPPPPAPAPHPGYVLGAPYQSGGVWRYPRESFTSDETGLAVVTTRPGGLTADGEVADPNAMAAAHPTLQLPALARITALDTGRQVVVRINDRGPEARGRVIALTPRVLQLLGATGQAAVRVRVQVLETESRQLAAQANAAGTPYVEIRSAPALPIAAETLAPPPGMRQASVRPAAGGISAPRRVAADDTPIPLRLPESVTQGVPRPGALYVEAGSFGERRYADMLRRRLAGLGAATSTSYDAPRDRAYRVRIGPLPDVAAADAMLGRTIAAGIGDARIIAE